MLPQLPTPRPRRQRPLGVPEEVAAINAQIEAFLNTTDETGSKIGNYRCGVYVFFDYDEEPIYVGQTEERIRVRIRRHLTNRRTDAVAMKVLDPFEVAYIEVYTFPELEGATEVERASLLPKAEYCLFQKVLIASQLGAVLNEKEIPPTETMTLPAPYRSRIVPDDVFARRQHPDVRLARRASTVAALAQIISEREVNPGLRRTLLTQARRIELLARKRLADFAGTPTPVEQPGEETGKGEST